jgi:long-chain acyl-CoA synthetase
LRDRGIQRGDYVSVDTSAQLNFFFSQALFALCAVGTIYTGRHRLDNPQGFDWRITDRPDHEFPPARTIVVDVQFLKEAADIKEPLTIEHYDSFTSVCRVVFSSGTTGEPLPVPLTVKNLDKRTQVAHDYWFPMRPLFSLVSMSSSIGLLASLSNMATATPYLVPGSPQENLEMVKCEFVGCLIASGVQLAELLQLSPSATEFSNLGMIVTAGGAPPIHLSRKLRASTDAVLMNFYGATESGGLMIGPIGESGDVRFDPPFPGAALEVVDSNDQPLPIGEVGTLRVKSEWQANGYYHGGEATKIAFRTGWFYSGDLAKMQENGAVSLHGRSGEVVNFGGVKIDLARADHLLSEYDGVKEAAVVGIEDEWGVLWPIVGYVPATGFDEEQMLSHCIRVLQGLIPHGFVEFDVLPRSALGKIRRSQLRDEIADAL